MIKGAAIIGIPDPLMGERVCDCIVPRSCENLTFEEMISFLKEKLIDPFELSEKLLLFDSLPYVSGIKLDRKQIKMLDQNQFNNRK